MSISDSLRTELDLSKILDLAVLYLRVSSKKQMDTAIDIDPDGNSIATQREVTNRKAGNLPARVVKEFIEPGVSASTIEKRPAFQEMIEYLREHKEIKYVIVYARSRAFRNYIDAAITKRLLDKFGVKLISAREDFGDGIFAEAMEAITDIFNDTQNKLSGEDIRIKLDRVSAYTKQADGFSLRQVIERVEAAPRRRPAKTEPTPRIHRLEQRLSPATVAELVKAYRCGTPTPALCKQYHISKGGVLKLLADHGVAMRNQRLTDEQIAIAAEHYEAGDSLVTIAQTIGSAATTVRAALKARGILMRPAGGSRAGRKQR